MKSMRDGIEDSRMYQMLVRKERKDVGNTILWIIGIIATIAAVAGIAYAVYRYFSMDYMKDFSDDFEEDYFEDEEFYE